MVYWPEHLPKLQLSKQGLWLAGKQKSNNKPVVTASELSLLNRN